MRVIIASFSRASEGALSKLKREMGDMLTTSLEEADYVMAVGDREETFKFVLNQWEQGKKIIHLWAGENNTNTKDDIYRTAMTLMSDLQLCTNPEAKEVVEKLCEIMKKKANAVVVGNVMLDNLEIDESLVPKEEYDLILENPGNPELFIYKFPPSSIGEIIKLPSLPRDQFLGLLKNCAKFKTNSSCEYYEAPIFLKAEQIVHLGSRNESRNSKTADMAIKNATANIIKALEETQSKAQQAN